MEPPSHETPIGHDDVDDALAILRDVIEWALAPNRWAEVTRAVTALTAALAADDGGALRSEVLVLELLGPVRSRQAAVLEADIPVPVPGAVRDQVLAAIGLLAEFRVPAPVAQGFIPVTIFLSDGAAHEQVEAAVEQLLGSAGLYVASRGEPLEGSWFRRLLAGARSAAAREALADAVHTAESRLVLQQDAVVTATLMQNVGPLIAALQPTKDAVVRLGAVLIVKIDWVLVVHQLTPRQQLMLDHAPELAAAPGKILSALGLGAAEIGPAIPGSPAV